MRNRTWRRSLLRRARASAGASARHGRATDAAPHLRPPRAPGRTCKRAGRIGRCAPATIPAENRPRYMRGRREDRAAGTQACGTTSVFGSSLDGDEVAVAKEHLAAELGGEVVAR